MDTTATRDVPETTRCGMDVELASTGTISAPPPTPTVAPNAPARTPSGADIVVALARSVAETEDASPTLGPSFESVARKTRGTDPRRSRARARSRDARGGRPGDGSHRARETASRGEVWRVDDE